MVDLKPTLGKEVLLQKDNADTGCTAEEGPVYCCRAFISIAAE